MKILMVSSEATPFVKVGGLADAVGGLGRALAALGHEVVWCLPRYRGLNHASGADVLAEARLELPLAGPEGVTLRRVSSPEGGLLLADAPGLFEREGLYVDPATGLDHHDNAERFAVLSAAACAAAGGAAGFTPDVIHCHDHPAALVPVLLRRGPEGLRARRPMPVVFTIHNLEHQGVTAPGLAGLLGLDPLLMATMGPLEFHGMLNPMKGAIVLSDRVTTVSPTYAEEICRPELGAGLDGVLRERREVLHGILNGVDTAIWDPKSDSHIARPFSPEDLAGKAWCRRALLEAVSLRPAGPSTLVIGMISRLVQQKGIDLVLQILDALLAEDVRLVVLGVGDPRLEAALESGAHGHPGRMAFLRAFDERMAHLIEAGSSLFLMPSYFEPCGLNQMYSMRYGTVPLVRATGGLADTVFDPDESPERANGFVFRAHHPMELLKTIRRAHRAFRDRRLWKELMVRGMSADFSWRRSARVYEEVYRKALADAAGRAGAVAPGATAPQAAAGGEVKG